MKPGLGSNGNGKRPILVAFEDSIVIFIYTFAATVLALTESGIGINGFSDLLVPFLLATVAGVLSWSKARDIHIQRLPDGP